MKRTWFMSYIIHTAFKRVGLIALANGTLEGALEQAMDGVIKEECSGTFKDEAQKIIKQFGSVERAVEATLGNYHYLGTKNE